MDRRSATRLSKFLSLVLRHRPDEYGLDMDERGFVDFDGLIDVLAAEDIVGEDAEEIVRALVEESERPRFAIQDGRIRALYGHSARISLSLPEDEPPETLYHGATPAAAARIAEEGLKPAGRAFVHLSATAEEALSVGRRSCDDPVLIRVDTAAARAEGVTFHQATDLIWLCPALPVPVCDVPDASGPAPPPSPSAPPASGEGVRVVGSAPEGGFKRRTRKKNRR